MLTLEIKEGHGITIDFNADAGVDPNMTISQFFENNELYIEMNKVLTDKAKLSISAPKALNVDRVHKLKEFRNR